MRKQIDKVKNFGKQLSENSIIIDWDYIVGEYESYKRIMGNHANMNFVQWLNNYYIISEDAFNKINSYDYFKIQIPLRVWLKDNFDIPKDKGHHHGRQ